MEQMIISAASLSNIQLTVDQACGARVVILNRQSAATISVHVLYPVNSSCVDRKSGEVVTRRVLLRRDVKRESGKIRTTTGVYLEETNRERNYQHGTRFQGRP